MSKSPIHIASVQPGEIDEVVAFVIAARAQIFPMLDARVLPNDLAHFQQVYLGGDDGHFWLARCEGEVVAAVGYLPFDHRFPQLDYHGTRTVEIVRLFVAPAFRRGGLAKALYARLREHAEAAGVQALYLHTHPFLPGAVRFWERQGFTIVDVEADPLWQTTHMQCLLPTLR